MCHREPDRGHDQRAVIGSAQPAEDHDLQQRAKERTEHADRENAGYRPGETGAGVQLEEQKCATERHGTVGEVEDT
jgi:hypothetical protein